jgi:predicted metal-binding protein
MTLLVCQSCPRYDLAASGDFRRAIDHRIAEHCLAEPGLIRHVLCLGGCPEGGVAAVDGPGQARVRFTKLTATDAEALIQAARHHAACASGVPGDWEVPAELQDRISSVSIKRQSRSAPTPTPPSTPALSLI